MTTLQRWTEAGRGRAIAIAKERNVAQSTVSAWVRGTKQIPLDHCPFIEEFTGGEVTCEELRPDKASYFALLREQAGRRGIHAAPVAVQGAA